MAGPCKLFEPLHWRDFNIVIQYLSSKNLIIIIYVNIILQTITNQKTRKIFQRFEAINDASQILKLLSYQVMNFSTINNMF